MEADQKLKGACRAAPALDWWSTPTKVYFPFLDEATAFADPESEYLVQQALNKLIAGRTVLVIAHRLHTITNVDNIVVVDQGKIVESGTHASLLSEGGRYCQLWDASRPAISAQKEEI